MHGLGSGASRTRGSNADSTVVSRETPLSAQGQSRPCGSCQMSGRQASLEHGLVTNLLAQALGGPQRGLWHDRPVPGARIDHQVATDSVGVLRERGLAVSECVIGFDDANRLGQLPRSLGRSVPPSTATKNQAHRRHAGGLEGGSAFRRLFHVERRSASSGVPAPRLTCSIQLRRKRRHEPPRKITRCRYLVPLALGRVMTGVLHKPVRSAEEHSDEVSPTGSKSLSRHSETFHVERTSASIDRGFPAPGSRFPVPGSRLPAPGSRLPAPGSRLPAPGSRLPAPGSRLPAPG
jgi:hypothetical protein